MPVITYMEMNSTISTVQQIKYKEKRNLIMEEENIMDYSNNIKKGDIFYVSYAKDYMNGDDDTGRPSIIVSSDTLNLHSEYVKVVYLTTKQKKPMPTHTFIYCKKPSMALCETIDTIEKSRLGTYIRTLTNDEMYRIDCCIMCSLGIDFQTAIELKTERDLYKKLYKELLEKVVKSMD